MSISHSMLLNHFNDVIWLTAQDIHTSQCLSRWFTSRSVPKTISLRGKRHVPLAKRLSKIWVPRYDNVLRFLVVIRSGSCWEWGSLPVYSFLPYLWRISSNAHIKFSKLDSLELTLLMLAQLWCSVWSLRTSCKTAQIILPLQRHSRVQMWFVRT